MVSRGLVFEMISTTNAEEFNLDEYLMQFDVELLEYSESRKFLTRLDPLLFALTYLPHHLRGTETGDEITFSDFHLDVVQRAEQWVVPVTKPAEDRHAYIAPRSTGKSTWLFLILPLWAAAHGHVKFVMAFAAAGGQAENHLQSFRQELQTNALLREDFPEMEAAVSRKASDTTVNNRTQLTTNSGFTFIAKGIDSSTLGAKVGNQRPDLLILDDIEEEESNYSAFKAAQKLVTVQDAILPLNNFARVVMVGTVTMADSIIHTLVKNAQGVKPAAKEQDWITEEKIQPHYYAPIIEREDGTERSMWPAKWSMEFLNENRHTRTYKKNFENDPLGRDGAYWTMENFKYGEPEHLTRWLISIDPAVTQKASSDFTGIAVLAYSPIEKKFCVVECVPVKLAPDRLRDRVMALLTEYPMVSRVLVETNQGGDVWKAIFHDLPVPVLTVHQSVKKEVRAAGLLVHYERGRILHSHSLPQLEGQMVGFPNAAHDDLIDAVGSGIELMIRSIRKAKTGQKQSRSLSYI